MALNRESNKLKLKSYDQHVDAFLRDAKDRKNSTVSPPTKQNEEQDCVIIDEVSTGHVSKDVEVLDKKVLHETSELEEVSYDLQQLRNLLLQTRPNLSLEEAQALPDLPKSQDSHTREATVSPPSEVDECYELAPLPQPCRFCYARRKPIKKVQNHTNDVIKSSHQSDIRTGIEDKRNSHSRKNLEEQNVIGPDFDKNDRRLGVKRLAEDEAMKSARSIAAFGINDSKNTTTTAFVKNSEFQNKSLKSEGLKRKSTTVFEPQALRIEDGSDIKRQKMSNRTKMSEEEVMTLEGTRDQTDISSVCPLCQTEFPTSFGQVEMDCHIAQCLSESGDDVVW